METITYNLQNDDYYNDIASFTDEILDKSHQYLDSFIFEYNEYFKDINPDKQLIESIFESLMLGVFWHRYGSRSLNLENEPQKLLVKLSHLRQSAPELKEDIDEVKGYLSTMFLLDKSSTIPGPNLENINKLLRWLEASGEYIQELKPLYVLRDFLATKTYEEIEDILSGIFSFSKYFCDNAKKTLGKYTSHVDTFINQNITCHINQEDIIFCSRTEIEYHLNMFGAEIMNRIFKADFEKRPRKAVLLPGCMKNPKGERCIASEERLGECCKMCNNNCPVCEITKKGLKDNFEVYIISHESSAFSNATEKDNEELGVVGVACVLNLIAGGWKARSIGMPAQCVILNYVGCSNHWTDNPFSTSINYLELEKILS